MLDTTLKVVAAALLLLLTAACQPTENPTNIAEGGRKAMDKAKAVEGQLQQRADQPRKDEEQK